MNKLRVAVDGGKYVFIEGDVGDVKILRHQEDWLNITVGAKAITALMYELAEADEKITQLRSENSKLRDEISRYKFPDTTGR